MSNKKEEKDKEIEHGTSLNDLESKVACKGIINQRMYLDLNDTLKGATISGKLLEDGFTMPDMSGMFLKEPLGVKAVAYGKWEDGITVPIMQTEVENGNNHIYSTEGMKNAIAKNASASDASRTNESMIVEACRTWSEGLISDTELLKKLSQIFNHNS